MKKIAKFYGIDIDLEIAIKKAIGIHENYEEMLGSVTIIPLSG